MVSLVVAELRAQVRGFLTAVVSLVVAELRAQACGFQELWCMGFIPWHVESSPTRDRTHVPRIVWHWTTREVVVI